MYHKISQSACQLVTWSISQSVCHFVHLYPHPPVYPSVGKQKRQSIRPVSQYFSLSVNQSVCLFIHPPVHWHSLTHPSTHPSVHQLTHDTVSWMYTVVCTLVHDLKSIQWIHTLWIDLNNEAVCHFLLLIFCPHVQDIWVPETFQDQCKQRLFYYMCTCRC